MVGEMRGALEHAGLWDSTSLLISGDHGLRPWLWRGERNWTPEMERLTADGASSTVPFILKLAGRNHGVVHSEPFSALLSADLIMAVLDGRVSTEEEASTWLARRGSDGSFGAQ